MLKVHQFWPIFPLVNNDIVKQQKKNLYYSCELFTLKLQLSAMIWKMMFLTRRVGEFIILFFLLLVLDNFVVLSFASFETLLHSKINNVCMYVSKWCHKYQIWSIFLHLIRLCFSILRRDGATGFFTGKMMIFLCI